MTDDFDIKYLDLGAFSGIFSDTTNSYKFLFFLSLLDIARDKKDEKPVSICLSVCLWPSVGREYASLRP